MTARLVTLLVFALCFAVSTGDPVIEIPQQRANTSGTRVGLAPQLVVLSQEEVPLSSPSERFDRLSHVLMLSASEEAALRGILAEQAVRMAAIYAESEAKLLGGMGPAPTREIAEQTDDVIDEATEVAAEGYVEAYREAHAAVAALLGPERWRRFTEIERGGTAEIVLALYGGGRP